MKQPAICSCLSVLTANPWACFKAYCTEEGSEISGGSDIKDCAEQFKPNIMYISNRRTLFPPLLYIYRLLAVLTAISHVCWDRVYRVLPAWTSVHSSKPGRYSEKSLFTIKIWLPPPKTPVFGGMLRKTPISPYIWWFWGAFGGLGGLLSGMAAVWIGMTIYGGI